MSQSPVPPPSDGTIRIAGWNIQHLGSRRPRRTPSQLSALAVRLLSLGASVYVLQEIESLPVLKEIAGRLGSSWAVFFERRHSNALLYDSRAVDLMRGEILTSTNGGPYPGSVSRKPVLGEFVAGAMRLVVIGVHLHWAKKDVRAREAEWIAKAARASSEHVLVFGDFNAEPQEKPHKILSESLARLPKQNGYSTLLPFGLHFDHIYVSKDTLGVIQGEQSFIVKPTLFGDSMRKTLMVYSDHLPVYADIRVGS